MKTLLTLTIWMAAFAGLGMSQTTQLALRELSIDDRKVRDVYADDEGYLVMALAERKAPGESLYGNMYTTSLMRLGHDLTTVWDVSWPETIMPEFKAIATGVDRCYIAGSHFDPNTKKSVGVLTKLDAHGQFLDSKEYAIAGFHSTEISSLKPLGNGELLLIMNVYHNYGSAGLPCLVRVDDSGKILWQRILESAVAYAFISQTLMLQDGGLLVACQVMPTREDLRNSKSVYSLSRVNPGTGQVLWTRRIPELQGLQQLLQEPEGSLVAFCCRDGVNMRSGQIVRLRTDGTMPQVLFRGEEGEGLVERVAVVGTDPKGVYSGVEFLNRGHYRFMKMRTDGEVLWEHKVSAPSLVTSDIRSSGGMLMAFQHKLVLAE